MGHPVRFTAVGDTAFNVEFGDAVDPLLNARVMELHARVKRAAADGALAGVVETVPTFRSLLVVYDPVRTSRTALEAALAPLLPGEDAAPAAAAAWRLPACYDADFAPDLPELAAAGGLSPEEAAARHAAGDYVVYMLGFMPGLAYMGGVEPALRRPRRSVPRVAVPAGSVAVAGGLTTVYPWESPGGWHLIGRCPVPLFDAARDRPVLLAAGDRVRFAAVDRAAFDAIAAEARDGRLDAERFRETP